jgi:hypothetical protein
MKRMQFIVLGLAEFRPAMPIDVSAGVNLDILVDNIASPYTLPFTTAPLPIFTDIARTSPSTLPSICMSSELSSCPVIFNALLITDTEEPCFGL